MSMAATAQTIPAELLIKIFKSTVPSREEALEFGKISLNHGPWGLGRICGRWRETVLDMPCMWSELFLSIPTGSAPWINYPIALLKEQISRGGQHPMRVCLISEEQPGDTTANIFAAIVGSCARWETLELVSKWPLPASALRSLHNNIPRLREIRISTDSDICYVEENVFELAPALKVVRLTEPRLLHDWTLPHFHPNHNYNDNFMWPDDLSFGNVFPWNQLTHYESECIDPYHFDAICQAENLVVCQASILVQPGRHIDWHPPSQLVHFMHLQKLSLLHVPGPLLDKLVLPALQDFFIDISPTEFLHVVSLLQRSKCTLRKFWMKSFPLPVLYRAILVANPDIIELGVIGDDPLRALGGPLYNIFGPCTNIDNIIRALRTDAAQLLVPHLQSFCIHNQAADLNVTALVDMVEGRMTAGLERVTVTECQQYAFPLAERTRLLALEA